MIVKLFAALVLSWSLGSAAAAARPGPVLVVRADYPGANCRLVADTIAAPIEQQVEGTEGLVRLWSRSGNDGTYTLRAVFKPGVDPNIAQVLVQNRVALAMPVLPMEVNKTGVRVLKQPGPIVLFVKLLSPGGRFDVQYLSNYAASHLEDELKRVPGVGGLVKLGWQDSGLRIWLDPEKLAARNLTAADVVRSLQEQNVKVSSGKAAKGKDAQTPLVVNTMGRLTEPEQLAKFILKVNAQGGIVYLRDVGRVELGGAGRETFAAVDGKPAVVLAVTLAAGAAPRDVSTALRRKLAQLRKHLPDGLDLGVALDFSKNLTAPGAATTPGSLLIEPELPADASAERTRAVLRKGAALLAKVKGVGAVLALSEDPFAAFPNHRPCLLVQTAATRERADRDTLVQTIRARLGAEVKEARVRLRDLSGPGPFPAGYPIKLAVSGPDQKRVDEWGRKLAERLGQSTAVTDVATTPGAVPQKQLYMEVDRTKCKTVGISMHDVWVTLQVYLGSMYVADFKKFGRTWQVTVSVPDRLRDVRKIRLLKVRNAMGEMVPLGVLMEVREIKAPAVLDRLDGRPMIALAGNPAAGVALAEARSACQKAAEAIRKDLHLPPAYRLTWLRP